MLSGVEASLPQERTAGAASTETCIAITTRINKTPGQLALCGDSSHRNRDFVRRRIVTGSSLRVFGPLLLLSLATLSCGGSRHLQSVTLQPSAATAQNGQVQFSATGKFSAPPSPATLTSKDVTWCTGELASAPNASPNSCIGNAAPFATVDQNGLATCSAASHGTGYILAGAQPVISMNPDGGSQFRVFGYATLTCP